MTTTHACSALRRFIGTVAVAGAVLAGWPVRAALSADDIRGLAARWLEGYDQTLATLVATETYAQRVRAKKSSDITESVTARMLVSEFAWVTVLGGRDVIGLRAVRRIDDRIVGEAGRLEALLRDPAPDRETQVQALLAESVRYLQVPSAVNFNFPTFALSYLRPENADRARWSVREGTTQGTAELRFREKNRTLVRTPDGHAIKAEGSFLLERATGRMLDSHVRLNGARTANGPPPNVEQVVYDAHVQYGEDSHLAIVVPTVMEDRYEWRVQASDNLLGLLVIDGRSTYTEYRRFATEGRIVPP